MFLTLAVTWTLATTCPVVNHYREQGYTDAQIEAYAREHNVPEWLIALAKRHCKK